MLSGSLILFTCSPGEALLIRRKFCLRDVPTEAARLRAAVGLNRICIHADTWALAVTSNDPERELESLMCGCLLASCRAASGRVSVPTQIPSEAEFHEPPYPPISTHDGLSLVYCAAPYLERPKATIGLGDTFLAGTLLRLHTL